MSGSSDERVRRLEDRLKTLEEVVLDLEERLERVEEEVAELTLRITARPPSASASRISRG